MLAEPKLVALFLLAAVECLGLSASAIEVTEPAGASHGYPGLCDINGKKLADGEFRQWIENKRLHVVITYKFSDGHVYEEQAQFRQQPALTQEKWSWKESKKMERRSANSPRIFFREWPVRTSAKTTGTCQKRLT